MLGAGSHFHPGAVGVYRNAMLARRTLVEFRRDPNGGYVAGERWLYFTFGPHLSGFALWGAVDGEDIGALVRLMELELDREPHAGFVDNSRVEGFSPDAFLRLGRYVMDHAERLGRIIRSTSMVLPPGLMGAIAAGFFRATSSPFQVSYFQDAAAAFKAIGCDGAACAKALNEAVDATRGVDPLLLGVRTYVDAHLAAPSVERAAKATGASVRTIQRRLATLGTSFVQEVHEARLRAAERLLTSTEVPLTRIAFEIGCSSPQHFSSFFRKARGETPSEYRQRTHERWKHGNAGLPS